MNIFSFTAFQLKKFAMRTIISIILFIVSISLQAQDSFDKYFTDKVLRFDFMLAGNSRDTKVYPVGMKEEPFWAGSKSNLINMFNSGNFKYELYEIQGNTLIYSRPVLYSVPGMADNR